MFKVGKVTYQTTQAARKAISNAEKEFPGIWLKVMKDSANIARKHLERNFATEGKEFGRSWASLAPGTLADRKRKNFKAGPKLVRRGWLRASVVDKRSSNHVEKVNIYQIWLGSKLRTKRGGRTLFKIHQEGTKHIPARQMIKPKKFVSEKAWKEIELRMIGGFVEIREIMEKKS